MKRQYRFLLKYAFVIGLSILMGQNPFNIDSVLTDSLPQFLTNTIEIADINNDNIDDIITTGYDAGYIGSRNGLFFDVLFGQDDGTLEIGLQLNFLNYSDTISEYIGGFGGITSSDFNRDGWIDTYLHGSGRSYLLENQYLNDTLIWTISNELDGTMYLTYSDSKWGDVNMDGAPDLMIMGVNENGDFVLNKLFINNDGGTFTQNQSVNFPEVHSGGNAWADFDNDGDPDFIIGGSSADINSSITRFYQNDPIGNLFEDTNQDIIGLRGGTYKFVDLDSDGDLDLIVSGWNRVEAGGVSGEEFINSREPSTKGLVTRIYINQPTGSFSLAPQQIDFGIIFGSIDAVDYDLDGDKDFVIAGADSIIRTVDISIDAFGQPDSTLHYAARVHSLSGKVYRNNGNFSFTEVQSLPGARTVKFIDINHNGIPDLLVNGTSEIENPDSTFFNAYINSIDESNQPPSAPQSLSAFAVSTRTIFTWSNATDDIDSTISLNYNLKIGTTSDGYDLLSPALPYNHSNNGSILIREFNEITHGTYYWSVQSVDGSGQVSEWSPEDTLSIPRLVPSTQSIPGLYFSTAGWADYNEDEKLDLGLTGLTFSGGSVTALFENDQGLLTKDLNQDIPAVFGGHLSWVDYTNDGHLDLTLNGFQTIDFNSYTATFFYKWDNGIYVYDEQSAITSNYYGYNFGINGGSNSHTWGDYDNDGDLDFAIGGNDLFSTRHLKVFTNNNGDMVLDTMQNNLVPLYPCMLHWEDMNNDGYLDLITIGGDSSEAVIAQVYTNDSDFILDKSSTLINPNIAVTAGAFDFADYNNDGYIDFTVTGLNSQGNLITYIIKNNEGQTIEVDGSISGLTGVYFGKPTWGDYDSDGDIDLLVSGYSDTTKVGSSLGSAPISYLYTQTNGDFTLDESIVFDGLGGSFSQFGDYDRDGDLDLLISGFNAEQEPVSKVFDNLEGIKNYNKAPNSPYLLDASEINNDEVTLSWSAPSDPMNNLGGYTSDNALQYQLQVGNSDNNNDHEIISGNYGVARIGITNLTTKKINSIPEGNYKWRVRAMDHGFSLSDWSRWDYFYVDITAPKVDSIRANYVTKNQIILIIEFKEDFYLDFSVDPKVQVTHPDNIAHSGDDTLTVEKQSYNGNEWTGILELPNDYAGQAIQIHISGAQDERKNILSNTSIFKTPETVIAIEGGTSISQDGNASLLVPQGALNQDASFTIQSTNGGNSFGDSTTLITNLYTISPTNLTLDKPGLLRIAFEDSLVQDSGAVPFIGQINTRSTINPLGGSKITIDGNPYLQVQVDKMGTFGIFSSNATQNFDSLNVETLVCQPRIFSPGGSIFEFTQTNILYDLEKSEKVTARIFNISGSLKRTIKPEFSGQPGHQVLNWDGRDSDGDVVKSGLYIVTLEKGDTILRTTVGVLNR